MQAIILAAGRGERMMPLTQNIPKPLLKIAGKPMMEYVIDLLVKHGVKEIGVNLYYLGKQIKNHFGDGSKYGIKITFIEELELTGTAGGIKNIAKILNFTKPFFVISSDMLVNFPLTDIYEFHQSHSGIATLSCYWRPKDQLKKSGVILFDQKNQIKQFQERPQIEQEIISQWVNSSVYVFDPKILQFIPDEINRSKIVDLPKHIFPEILSSAEQMYAYPINRKKYYQLGIDTPERIKKAEQDIIDELFEPVNIQR